MLDEIGEDRGARDERVDALGQMPFEVVAAEVLCPQVRPQRGAHRREVLGVEEAFENDEAAALDLVDVACHCCRIDARVHAPSYVAGETPVNAARGRVLS